MLDPSTTITDADDSSLTTIGVAVTSASTTEGEWEYSTDSGATWTAFADSSPSDATALLLRYFVIPLWHLYIQCIEW